MELIELYEKTIHKWKKIRNMDDFRNDEYACVFCRDAMRLQNGRFESDCDFCRIDHRLCYHSAGIFGKLDILAFNQEKKMFKETLKQGKKLLKRIWRKLYWKRYFGKYGRKGKC